MRRIRLGGLDTVVTGGTDGDGGGTGPVVVLLHGYGAPGDDLVSLWRAIDVPRSVRFVFPAGPISLEHEFGGAARAWWHIDMDARQRASEAGRIRELAHEVPDGLLEARTTILALLDELRSTLAAPSAGLVLGGFSQGAMLSCDVAFCSSALLQGLVLLSGTLIAEDAWRRGMPSRRGLAVIQSHGSEDPLLPPSMAEVLRDAMRDAGLSVEWLSFRGQHEIPTRVVDALGGFLRGTFGLESRHP